MDCEGEMEGCGGGEKRGSEGGICGFWDFGNMTKHTTGGKSAKSLGVIGMRHGHKKEGQKGIRTAGMTTLFLAAGATTAGSVTKKALGEFLGDILGPVVRRSVVNACGKTVTTRDVANAMADHWQITFVGEEKSKRQRLRRPAARPPASS